MTHEDGPEGWTPTEEGCGAEPLGCSNLVAVTLGDVMAM